MPILVNAVDRIKCFILTKPAAAGLSQQIFPEEEREMNKKILSLLTLLVLASMVLAACKPAATATVAPTKVPAGPPAVCTTDPNGCAVIKPGQTIKIGMGAPMTGDNANFGVDISQGAMIAVSDAGDFQGFKFELVAQDDGGSPEGGATVANKLVTDATIVAVAGHIFSGATEAAMPIYEKAGVPMMSPSATNPPLTQKGSKVFNRVAFTDAVQGKFAAAYLFNKLGFKKIAIMHDGAAYGQGLASVVQDNFKQLGGEVVYFGAITPGEADYSAPLAAVAAAKPEALYYGGYVQEAVILVNQMKTAGLTGVAFFGCDGTFGEDFLQRTGANGEGAYSTSLFPAGSTAKQTFDAAYEAKFGKKPGVLSPFTWNAYDSAAVLIAQIKKVAVKVGDTLYIPRGALVAAVRATSGYQGLGGKITCDATGECNSTGPTFVYIKSGAWVEAAK